ncbi:endonuclease/exonuclease/phosphatase family protein [Kribbella sp. CA-247076]|uniref:endonuclease/exonuclease/phosphatase family protein n=1 Tax=Kribbella sp. CA-247076 TaxID=3239941 RepID=UPI003D90C0EA
MPHLTLATLNTRGIPVVGSQLPARFRKIAGFFEESDVEVVNLQEVLTYYHLRLLVRRLRSYPFVSYRRSLVGPAGGLVTFSRRPIEASTYHRFRALKGTLVTRFSFGYVVNTHPTANPDGDWSESNRFYKLHREQLATLTDVIDALPGPAAVGGDFNVARDSKLFHDFITTTHLTDAFAGACPPTFHAAYLPPGRTAHCIDFVLVTGTVRVESTDLILPEPLATSSGPVHVSDHLGLRATLLVDT